MTRSYHHRHLDFTLSPGDSPGMRRLTVHSAEVLRSLLGGDRSGGDAGSTGYPVLGSAILPEAVAEAVESVLRDLRTPLAEDAGDLPSPLARRRRRTRQAERLEAFFSRHRGNPLVRDGVVVDPNSESGRRIVAQLRAGQAEPRLLADWVRLRIEWRQILADL